MTDDNEATRLVVSDLATTSFVWATISSISKEEDPHRLGRIHLDFEDNSAWVQRELVFTRKSNLTPYFQLVGIEDFDKSNEELELPPQGTLVVVLTIQSR